MLQRRESGDAGAAGGDGVYMGDVAINYWGKP